MLGILRAVIDAYVGQRWRVTATREGGDYVIDVDNGRSIVRARGRTLEQAEDDVAVQVARRLRRKDPDDLLPLLQAALASQRRKSGLAPVRLVKPHDPACDTEAPTPEGDQPRRGGECPANDNDESSEEEK